LKNEAPKTLLDRCVGILEGCHADPLLAFEKRSVFVETRSGDGCFGNSNSAERINCGDTWDEKLS